jgi:hypothetical protein
VRVERNDELTRRHGCPSTGIDAVAAHHPAQKQVEALARGARGRAREEVPRAGRLRLAAVDRRQVDRPRAAGERLESRADVGRGGIKAERKRALERSVLVEQAAQDPDERRQIPAPRPPVAERVEAIAFGRWIECADGGGWMIAEHRAHRLDRRHDRRHAAERQAGRDERDDLAVVEPRITAHDLDRIERRVRRVEGGVETIESVAHGQVAGGRAIAG